MAQTAALKATQRTGLGSRPNRRLRASGQIPAVVYGHKEAVIPIAVPGRELMHHLAHGAHVFSLDVEGKTETVLVKQVQYDHLGSNVVHVDFTRVRLDERVRVTVPLELRGTPKGEAEGGVLQQVIASLEIECLVTEIPERIRHNVADMELDSVLHIRDLKLPEGVRVLQSGDLIVATVREVLEAAPAEAVEAAAAEPEVIGRKAEEEPAAEAASPPAKEKEKEKESK